MNKLVVSLLLFIFVSPLYASGEEVKPDLLNQILSLHHAKKHKKHTDNKKKSLHVRANAVNDEAFMIGARAGLWWKGTSLQSEIKSVSDSMNNAWNFSRLMLDGGKIIPPVIDKVSNHIEARDDVLQIIGERYVILQDAHFAISPLNWRSYMLYDEFEKPDVSDVPKALLPTDDEVDEWKSNVMRGWKAGSKQAVEVMANNLNRMTRDFNGMLRYHVLLQLGMVTRPYVDRKFTAVKGDKKSMDVGTALHILKVKPVLNVNKDVWQAVPEIPDAFHPDIKGW